MLSSVVLMAALGVGCAPMEAYEGPRLSEGERSVIAQASSAEIMTQKAIPAILCVDGTEATGQTVHVTPGHHRIVGCYSDPSVFGMIGAKSYVCHLEFETLPGHEYRVNGGTRDGVPQMWVRDIGTDETVARVEATQVENLRGYDCGGGG